MAIDYPHPYLTVSLLDGCNKSCVHCYRTAVPRDHGFKLKRRAAYCSIDDATALGTACLFVGGEPTIWADGGVDYIDLLIAAANRHGCTALLSNGQVFEHQHTSNNFIKNFIEGSDARLLLKFTVDIFHGNYDPRSGNIKFIDNLLEAIKLHDRHRQVSLSFLTHWSRDKNTNMPVAICKSYEALGANTSIEDFMVWGRAEGITHESCYLEVGNSEKQTLGPLKEQLVAKLADGGVVENAADFESLTNRELLRCLHVCGKSPNFTLSWGEKYYYCIPQMGFHWFSISDIGKLDKVSLADFMERRPVIREIQRRSIFGLMEEYTDLINQEVLDSIECIHESIRFAGCSICLELQKHGVLEKINTALCSGD